MGIKQPIEDILTKLSTLQITNGDGNIASVYVNIWNNQLVDEKDGKLYDYPKPALFVEIINEAKYEEIGIGFQSCDLGIKIHLVHEFYNQDGTFEEDLIVFDLRDAIVALLSFYTPTSCGPMIRTGEVQDYEHDNLYHYTIDFITNFTDSKGSAYDADAGKYILSTPPTGLELDVEKEITIDALTADEVIDDDILQDNLSDDNSEIINSNI